MVYRIGILLIYIIITLFILPSASVVQAAERGRPPTGDDLKDILGSSLEESASCGGIKNSKKIEKSLENLSLIARNDVVVYGFGAKKEIDMRSRKVLFTEKGWEDYQKYIVWQREQIDVKHLGLRGFLHFYNRKTVCKMLNASEYSLSVPVDTAYFNYDFGGSSYYGSLEVTFQENTDGDPLFSQWILTKDESSSQQKATQQ